MSLVILKRTFPADTSSVQLPTVVGVVGVVGVQATIVNSGYAILFSAPTMTRLYLRLLRWFEGAFTVGFGLAG